MLRINDIAPNFEADSTHGNINFHEFIDNSWAVLFSHPKDFTPVCTTELGYMANIQEEFEHRHTVLMTKFSTLEEATWTDQICEATAYIADNSFETKLIHSLAEVRDLTTLQFATKIVDKQTEFKTSLYELAVAEQKMIHIVTGCTSVRELNVVLEDYFSIAMNSAQCLEYGRCTTNEETGNIERKVTFDYSGGLKF